MFEVTIERDYLDTRNIYNAIFSLLYRNHTNTRHRCQHASPTCPRENNLNVIKQFYFNTISDISVSTSRFSDMHKYFPSSFCLKSTRKHILKTKGSQFL